MSLSKFGWKDKAETKVKDLNSNELIILALIRASVSKLDLILCEDIFDKIEPSVLNKIEANTKIVVSNSYKNFDEYTTLIFGLANLKD